jgi:hypothetical protein
MFTPADGNGRICETFVLKEYSRRIRQEMSKGVSRIDAILSIDAEMFGDCSYAETDRRSEQERLFYAL